MLAVGAAACSDHNLTSPDLLAPGGARYTAAPAGSLVYIVNGNGQVGQAGTVVGPRDPSIVVRNSAGVGVANVDVTFTCSGNCALSNPTVKTDGSGNAATRWQLPSTNGTATLTAQVSGGGSVSFTASVGGAVLASTIAKAAGTDAQTATAGSSVRLAPTVTVRDAGGNLLAGATITFTPSGNGLVSNHVVITDANGQAATTWQLPTSSGTPGLDATANGGAIIASFTATATPIPGSLTTVSDTRANCGSTCGPNTFAGPADPVVLLKDNQGNPLTGTSGIVFTVSSGGGTLSNPNPTTDGSGNASTRWLLPTTAGTYTLTASVPAYPNVTAVSFTATVVMTPTQIVIVQGNNQTVAAGQLDRPSTPYVKVMDASNFVVAGAIVTFTPSGNGQVSNPSATTDASGQAATEWQLPTSGPFTMVACINGGSVCVTFTATSTAIPASMQIVAGNGESGTAGSVVGPRDPVVIVNDVNGNPITGITVVFTPSGNGVVSAPNAVTIANGQASTRWQLGTTPGTQTLTATVTIPNGGGTLTRTFTATAN